MHQLHTNVTHGTGFGLDHQRKSTRHEIFLHLQR